jgi:hypothetical protein
MSDTQVFTKLPLPDRKRPRVIWTELRGSAPALAAAEAAARHGGTVVVLAPNAAQADRLERELAFFGAARSVHRFPDYETLPYEPIAPPQDLLADRLRTLDSLARGEAQTLVVEAGALLTRLPPRGFVVARSLKLSVGEQFDRDAAMRRLTDHGYLRVDQVSEPGELAVRGALFDTACASSTPRRSSRRAKRTRSASCPRASFRSTRPASKVFASASASASPSSPAAARSIARSPKRSYRPASSTTCRSSSTRRRRSSITSTRTR